LNLHPFSPQQLFNFCMAACHARRSGNGLSATSSLGLPSRGVHPEHSRGRLSATIPGRVRTLQNSFALHSSSFVLILFILISCGKPLPTFENLDIAKWKEDKAACGKVRLETMEELTRQKDKLKGLSQDNIVELLGRPDQNELYKRNQKFFYYYLTPSKACGGDSTAHRLSLRFNAMGFAKEVLVE
jgi:hypothetical protein